MKASITTKPSRHLLAILATATAALATGEVHVDPMETATVAPRARVCSSPTAMRVAQWQSNLPDPAFVSPVPSVTSTATTAATKTSLPSDMSPDLSRASVPMAREEFAARCARAKTNAFPSAPVRRQFVIIMDSPEDSPESPLMPHDRVVCATRPPANASRTDDLLPLGYGLPPARTSLLVGAKSSS